MVDEAAPAAAEEPAIVYAAGSLRNVLPALAAAFRSSTGHTLEVRHGPAGLLREHIEAGERPDLFLSANLAHPARLAEIGLARPPVVFARNTLVALVRKDAAITTQNLVDRLLAPDVSIATSTPRNDPSGDYAWEVFRGIERIKPGAFAVLEGKAQKLVGAAEPRPSAGSYDVIADALNAGTTSLFLGYRTGLEPLAARLDGMEIVIIPPEINVDPTYGLTALNGCSNSGLAFALFMLSVAGQTLMAASGFRPVALP